MEQYDTLQEIKDRWYDEIDSVCPYKLVAGGEPKRFAFADIAMDAFEAEQGTAILFDHSDQQTKILAYKFVEK